MKLSDSTWLTRSGKLVPLISKWDTDGKGLSREQLRELAEELVLGNPTLAIRSMEEIEKEILSNHLVAYDTHSGLYFVCARMPVSPYPDDFKSPGRLTVEAIQARYSFQEQAWNKKLKRKYSREMDFEYWFELSQKDFEKWKLENGFVFSPGTVEKMPKVKPEKKPKKKNVKNTSKEVIPKYYNLGVDNTLPKLNIPKGFNLGG